MQWCWRLQKGNSFLGLFLGSIRFMAASLTSLWGLLPSPAALLLAGPCRVLQHPSLFPLPGIRGQSKETFPLLLLPRLCGRPASTSTHPGSRGLTPKQDPATAFALPSPPRFGFLAVPSLVKAGCGFASDIWEAASAALINTTHRFFPASPSVSS